MPKEDEANAPWLSAETAMTGRGIVEGHQAKDLPERRR